MKLRDQKLVIAVVSFIVFMACVPFTPGVAGSDTSSSGADPNQSGAISDEFQLPSANLLFSTDNGTQETTASLFDYFKLSVPDNVVGPFPLLVNVNPITGQPVYSPDYSHLAFERFDQDAKASSLYMFGPEKPEAQMIGQPITDTFFQDLTWSANGRFLTFWSNGGLGYMEELSVYDVQTGSLNAIPLGTITPFADLSPNGDQIAFSSQGFELDQNGEPLARDPQKSGLYLMNSDGTDGRQLLIGQVNRVQWHPDGKRLFYEKEETKQDENLNTLTISPSQVYYYDLASGVETLLTPSDKPVLLHDFSPDGKFFIYTGENGIFVISSDGGTPLGLPLQNGWVWSPDSQYFAYGEWNSQKFAYAIYIMDVQGRGRVNVYHDLPVHDLIAWLP